MEQDGGDTDISGFITLAQPRPGTARRQNEYIETPLRPQLPEALPKGPLKDECRRPRALPVTAQPAPAKKDPAPTEAADPHGIGDTSIICRQCRKCRCEACRGPRSLPQRWLCGNKCLCSAASVVDYCSCMCCVRGLFYHWAKDAEMDSDVSCADQPCSCAPHQRLLRWGCLGLLSVPLPCLCCYWPLRGCVRACEGGYAGCAGHGCRCPHRTKRLLEPDC